MMANPARIPPERLKFTFDIEDEVDAILFSIALLTAMYGEAPSMEDLLN